MNLMASKIIFSMVFMTNLVTFAQPFDIKNPRKIAIQSKLKNTLPDIKKIQSAQSDYIKRAMGGVATGGGVGFLCQENGKSKTYLADTYALVHSEVLKDLSPSDPAAIIAATSTLLDSLHPEKIYQHPFLRDEKVTFGWMVSFKYSQLHIAYVDQDLPPLNDDNIDGSITPEVCQKIQLAIQDIPKMTVYTKPYLEMSFVERGFLSLHETLIALRAMPGADTTPIRRDVEEVARSMHDPKFLERIISILKKDRIPENKNTSGLDYLFKHCGSRMLDPEPQPRDTEEVAACRKASALAMAQEESHNIQTALPTIRQIPSEFITCQASFSGYYGENPLGSERPEFLLQLIKGSGKESIDSGNVFRIQVKTKEYARVLTSYKSHFTQSHKERADGFRDFGHLNFSAQFKGENLTEGVLFLDNYDPLTGVLSGGFGYTDPTNQKTPDWYFGVSCYVGQLEFERYTGRASN